MINSGIEVVTSTKRPHKSSNLRKSAKRIETKPTQEEVIVNPSARPGVFL